MKKQIEVLFIKDLEKIAKKGEVKKVKFGFAKNYLIPQQIAKILTPELKKQIKRQKKIQEIKRAKLIEKLKKLALKLEKIKLKTKLLVGEKGEIFGSVDNQTILELLKNQTGIQIKKNQIEIKEPIKKIGRHKISIDLGYNIKPKIKLIIEKSIK